MTRRTLLGMMLGTALLAACGRRGEIIPPHDRPEDSRIDDFRKKRDRDDDKDGGR